MFPRSSKITPILFTVLTGIITGVVANRVDALFFSSNPQPKALFLASLIPWTIVGLLILAIASISYRWYVNRKMWEKLLILNEGLLRLFPNLIGQNDLDERFHKLIDRLLIHTSRRIPADIRRGILLMCDEKRNNDFLTICNSIGVQEEYEKSEEFYVGKDTIKLKQRGIAGKAFQTKEPFIVHIREKENGKWEADDEDYITFEHEENEEGDFPPYKSLICIPILDGPIDEKIHDKKAHKQCSGVVCFDSRNMHTFDFYETQRKLELLTKHICAALRTYNALKKRPDYS